MAERRQLRPTSGSRTAEAIMVPAEYRGLGRSELRLIAFSTGGVVIGNQRVTVQVYDTSGSSSSFLQAIVDYFVDCFGSFPEGCVRKAVREIKRHGAQQPSTQPAPEARDLAKKLYDRLLQGEA